MAKVRAHGEGMVRQRKDGRWEAKTPRDEFGRRITRTGTTRREALDKLARAKQELKRGIPSQKGARQKLEDMLDYWLEHVARPTITESTYESYELTIRRHIKPQLGKLTLEKLTGRHVREWYNALCAMGLKRTPSYARMILANALNYALEEEWVTINVAQNTMRRRRRTGEAQTRRKGPPLTIAQARRLLEIIRGERLEAVFLTMLCLGLRRGEVLGLRKSDVDLEQKQIHVAGSLRRTMRRLKRSDWPKSKAGERIVPIPDELIPYLQAYVERVAHERETMLEIGKWTDTDYFFVSSVGTAIEPRNLLRDYKKILASTNPINTTCPDCHKPFSGTQPPPIIERDGQVLFAHSQCIVLSDTPTVALPTTLSLHDLRHACATFLALNHVHPRVAMEILGHAHIKTTQEIYTHVLDESKVEAIDKMGAMLTLPQDDRVLELVPLRKQRKRA